MLCVPTDLPVLHLLPEDSKYPFPGNGKSDFTVLQFYCVLDMPVEFTCTYSKNCQKIYLYVFKSKSIF